MEARKQRTSVGSSTIAASWGGCNGCYSPIRKDYYCVEKGPEQKSEIGKKMGFGALRSMIYCTHIGSNQISGVLEVFHHQISPGKKWRNSSGAALNPGLIHPTRGKRRNSHASGRNWRYFEYKVPHYTRKLGSSLWISI